MYTFMQVSHQTLIGRKRSDRCVYIHASNQDKRLDRATLIGKLLQLDDAPSQPGIAKEPDTCGKEPLYAEKISINA